MVTCAAKTLILAATLTLSACPCGTSRRTLLYDGFDAACDTVACGWRVAAGEVAAVATLHPGERGLRLAAGAVIVRDVEALEDTTPQDMIDALVRCEAGAQLRFSVVMLVDDEIEREIALTTEGPVADQPRFTHVEGALVTEDAADNPGGVPLRVQIQQLGAGACVVDEVFFLRGPAFSCNG